LEVVWRDSSGQQRASPSGDLSGNASSQHVGVDTNGLDVGIESHDGGGVDESDTERKLN
jgi:hypothetical protein